MAIMDDPSPPTVPPLPTTDGAHLCVLASGSMGNCSALLLRRGGVSRCWLIDLGLSPRRTMALLANAGIGPHQLDGALVTHLDHDHLHATWRTQMPGHARVMMHHRHARNCEAGPRDRWRIAEFDGAFDLDEGVRVRPAQLSHDELGVSSFRIDVSEPFPRASLGFATDVGRVPVELLELFGAADDAQHAVDVLAIESNYCPALQHASDRPEVLKRRIMGGHGHLSNQEAVAAILQIEPREHVVLLHLSQQCNAPEVVSALHVGADYALTITSQHRPSRWVTIGSGVRTRAAAPVPARPMPARATLWDVCAEAGA